MLTGAKQEGKDLEISLPPARDLSGFPKQEKVGWSLGEIWISVSVERKEPSQTPKQNAERRRDGDSL